MTRAVLAVAKYLIQTVRKLRGHFTAQAAAECLDCASKWKGVWVDVIHFDNNKNILMILAHGLPNNVACKIQKKISTLEYNLAKNCKKKQKYIQNPYKWCSCMHTVNMISSRNANVEVIYFCTRATRKWTREWRKASYHAAELCCSVNLCCFISASANVVLTWCRWRSVVHRVSKHFTPFWLTLYTRIFNRWPILIIFGWIIQKNKYNKNVYIILTHNCFMHTTGM